MKIKCTYFKASGKYYADGEGVFDPALFEGCIYPKEIGVRLRELGKLPGLNSGTWLDGYFVVEPEDSYPELVKPDEPGNRKSNSCGLEACSAE